jgi:hypothetical protein
MRYTIYVALLAIAAIFIASSTSVADERPFRVVGNDKYHILDAKELYIYSADRIVRSVITYGRARVQERTEKAFFFSVGPNGDILPLTIANLKKAVPGNAMFHDHLDMAFNDDSELTAYDDAHKMFKVNHLLIVSTER